MNVLLKPELEKFVAETVEAGRYASASDIINEALEVLREQQDFSPDHEEYLKTELQRALEQLDRKEFAHFTAKKIIGPQRF